jgi:hypothetical protein
MHILNSYLIPLHTVYTLQKKSIEQHFVEGPSGTLQKLRRRKSGFNRSCLVFLFKTIYFVEDDGLKLTVNKNYILHSYLIIHLPLTVTKNCTQLSLDSRKYF